MYVRVCAHADSVSEREVEQKGHHFIKSTFFKITNLGRNRNNSENCSELLRRGKLLSSGL